MMAEARLSPTAHLLRTSRLFSLPPPLPPPRQNPSFASQRNSETATLPYPRYATIETTQSSLSRGDWGLKRALPFKSTRKTSTPLIRIDDLDSIFHITDFESAADHTLTLKKWQEIGLPVSILSSLPPRATMSRHRAESVSVFESYIDNSHAKGSGNQRWKFKGPWLAGQTEGDFRQYILKKVSKRKLEFKEFLKAHFSEKIAANRKRDLIAEGLDIGHEPITVSDKDIEVQVQRLRHDKPTLRSLVEKFLDLPNGSDLFAKPSTNTAYNQYSHPTRASDAADLYGNAPPKTHPSAGLSYLRTDPQIPNHPIFGPQSRQQPIQARVLSPQTSATGWIKSRAIIGVGGVAGYDDARAFFKSGDMRGITTFEPDIPGGAKVWVEPNRVNIDSQGCIKVQSSRAEGRALAIYRGIVEDDEVVSPNIDGKNRQFPDSAPTTPLPKSLASGYGLSPNLANDLY